MTTTRARKATLLAGDPGVGKSTLLLQVCAEATRNGAACAYISGEEAVEQIRARAHRMGLAETSVQLAAETALRDIMDGLKGGRFDLVVIDSIQTLWSDAHEAGPGSVTQVRACAGELVRLAKKRGIAVILVGHEDRAQSWWNSRPWWRPPCTERRDSPASATSAPIVDRARRGRLAHHGGRVTLERGFALRAEVGPSAATNGTPRTRVPRGGAALRRAFDAVLTMRCRRIGGSADGAGRKVLLMERGVTA